jgi:hypothetical protein
MVGCVDVETVAAIHRRVAAGTHGAQDVKTVTQADRIGLRLT